MDSIGSNQWKGTYYHEGMEKKHVDTLFKNIGVLVSCDDQNRVYENVSLSVEVGRIVHIGHDAVEADETVDCHGGVVYSGLVNTHHHLY